MKEDNEIKAMGSTGLKMCSIIQVPDKVKVYSDVLDQESQLIQELTHRLTK